MPGLIRIEVPPLWQRWTAGFADLPAQLAREGRIPWELANEEFFALTQQLAHVDTEEMRLSGSAHLEPGGHTEITSVVAYGSDHAIFEQARGGDHAFLSLAWERAEPAFDAALPEAFRRVVGSWR